LLGCKDVIKLISAYLDGEIDAETKRRIEDHLKGCRRCKVVFDSTRRTIELYCDGKPLPLPADVRERLHEALRRRWREKVN
ncbi:MAG: zf-HC2 domain-containing protein, partial [Acidobacteria bacterium]|nr:zf-HC2 domain-containing protein [Acidobacteriota bacterium]